MIHEILPVGPLRCNCSIIGDETTREAMVVDPGDDIAEVLAIIQKHNLQVRQIVITHAHIDHVGGAMKAQQMLNNRYFDSRLIMASFVPENVFNSKVKER